MSQEHRETWTCGQCMTVYEFTSAFDNDMPDDWFCIEDRGCHYVVCSLKCLKDFVRTYENGVEPTDPVRASASAASPPQSVVEAAKAFVARLDVIHSDPRYQWVWQNSQLHGGPYTGPSYADELTALRAALASQPKQEI